MFGWPMIETEQECSLLGRAGYLGVKLSPVNEHIMSDGVENGALNPWYYPYQPISYRFNSRAGTQENLVSLIRTCRSHGIRVYVDVILNHFTGHVERRSGKKSSAPIDRQSPFFTADDEVNPSTNQPFSYEYPGADVGPEDFHCERALDKWDDLNVLNTGWLAGLTSFLNINILLSFYKVIKRKNIF